MHENIPLSLIVACGAREEIGQGNKMPWAHLPADMAWFREKTVGHAVIMGRKTFESLPGPLKDRLVVVVTHKPDAIAGQIKAHKDKGAQVIALPDFQVAVKHAREWEYYNREEKVFVAGGAEIYRQAVPIASELLLTRVHSVFPKADTFFPMGELMSQWGSWETEMIGVAEKDGKANHNLTFLCMRRVGVFDGELVQFHRDKGTVQLGRDSHFTLRHLQGASFKAVPGRVTLVVQYGVAKTAVRFRSSAERDRAFEELRHLLAVVSNG